MYWAAAGNRSSSIDVSPRSSPDAVDGEAVTNSLSHLTISNEELGGPKLGLDRPNSGPTTAICSKYAIEKDKKTLVIFNNRYFVNNKELPGAEHDVSRLKQTFETCDFKVYEYNSWTAAEIENKITKLTLSSAELKKCDCLVVAILSHGATTEENKEVFYGFDDKPVEINEFIRNFKTCEDLAGKPKIFLFQICRGSAFDHGLRKGSTNGVVVCGGTDEDSHSEDDVDDGNGAFTDNIPTTPEPCEPKAKTKICRTIIPAEADFLYAYPAPPGQVAVGHEDEGSWFIQTLCEQIDLHADHMDLVSILTLVNQQMCLKTIDSTDPRLNGKKQVSWFASTLTKKVYLSPWRSQGESEAGDHPHKEEK